MLVLGQGRAHARGMAAHQVQLELGELGGRDHHGGELPEAGVDAVDGAPLGEDAVDDLAVLGHVRQGGLVQFHGTARSDGGKLDCREVLTIESNHCILLYKQIPSLQLAHSRRIAAKRGSVERVRGVK